MTSTRAVTSIAAGILALVVVAAVVVLLAENRGPTTFPAGSPQAAMQAYLAAWEQRDLETAYGLFSAEVKAQASFHEYKRAVDSYGTFAPDGEAVYIDTADTAAERASLHLTIEHYSGEGPGSNVYRSTATVRMIHEADGWKVDQPLIGVEPAPFPIDGPAF